MPEDRREQPRYPFSATAVIASGPGIEVGRVKDLSLGGCYVAIQQPLPENTLFLLTIHHGRESFTCQARVITATSGIGAGVQFVDPDGASRGVLNRWLAGIPIDNP